MAEESKKVKKKKKSSTLSQLKQIFSFTYSEDKMLPWLIAGAFFVPIIVAIVCGFVFKFGWLSWIMIVVLGIMVGVLLAMMTLTRRSDSVGYRKMDGRPGASAAVLSNISKAGFTFPQEPVWIDPKTKDAIWRGTGRSGIFLIGEGDYGRVMKAMVRQEEEINRITRGSAIPLYKISVGHGDNQVPLEKLQKTVIRKKVKLTPTELDQLKGRLNTLQMRQNALNMPKGIDPTKAHMSRRALRGK
ncbi:membrane protein [Bombiscardovia apis]|uniref:Membrane protein n=1 Tax=Bombiscardovia apis TaxID=2932182 RepID=A0ABN6SI33_9BIFI|nr:DUF4191 domain-containing protein [Bombiscardovia apis]BDR54887.1 membrane protein [Bombiscardovia apis]